MTRWSIRHKDPKKGLIQKSISPPIPHRLIDQHIINNGDLILKQTPAINKTMRSPHNLTSRLHQTYILGMVWYYYRFLIMGGVLILVVNVHSE